MSNNKDKLIADIIKAQELLKEHCILNYKIYLPASKIKYKEYMEKEGYEVILVDALSDDTIIFGDLENRKE